MTRADIEARVEQFKAALARAGSRQTHQRVAIFREVLASGDHPDVDSVFKAVKKRLPEVSLDTVYRTLWTLTDLGLLASLGPRHARVRFDANTGPHHHYVCRLCGAAHDFESAALHALPVPEGVKDFGSIEGTHVEVRGVCARCAAGKTRHVRAAPA